jgi:hypothetical protein
MAILTGANGELRYNGIRVAKCRNFSIDISRDALETTNLGVFDKTYVEGLRGATGSATIIYDNDEIGAMSLLRSIFLNSGSGSPVAMILNTSTDNALEFNALVTQVSTPVSVGEVTACSVSFQVTGPFEGVF